MKTLIALALAATLATANIYEANFESNIQNMDNYTTSPDDSYYEHASTPDQYDNTDPQLDSNYVPDYRYIIEPPTVD